MSAGEPNTATMASAEAPNAVVPEGAETTAASPSMGSAVLTGLSWKVATVLVSDVTRIAVAVVLARLLTPADYGMAGMGFVFSGLADIFSDFALGGGLVPRLGVTQEGRSPAF